MKSINVSGWKIPYQFKDNKSSSTILMIHGFTSSSKFAKELFKEQNNYNIVAIDLPGSLLNPTNEEMSLEIFGQIVNRIIEKNIKTAKVILLGHSLAGGILAKIWQNKKIESLIFLSTITPYMTDVKLHKALSTFHSPSGMLDKIKNLAVRKTLDSYRKRRKSQWIDNFTSPALAWRGILLKSGLNKKYLWSTLDLELRSINKKVYAIVGSRDIIIGTSPFTRYFEEIMKVTPLTVPGISHNPIDDNAYMVNQWLNNKIPFRKRFWFRKAFS